MVTVHSPACILCRQLWREDDRGLYIKGRYICPECETRILMLSRNDPDYDYCKWGLKKIWY
jgi:DNA-directed RNA polymerase subunit RPC12/RpoP